MARGNRARTRGNHSADYTALRGSIDNINPAIKSTLRNAVPRNGQSASHNELEGVTTINPFKLERLSNIISNNINAATDLRQITPYIDKAELIWNTILFYPNGKQEKILTHDTRPSKHKSAKLHDEILKRWDNYYTNDYKIDGELKPIASDILWNTGSYTLFNLSRPGLDYLINGSETIDRDGNESFRQRAQFEINKEFVKDPKGMLRAKNYGRFVRDPNAADKTSVNGMEALLGGRPTVGGVEFDLFGGDEFSGADFNITLTDNPSIIYNQKINEVLRENDVSRVMGMESLNLVVNTALAKSKEKKEKDEKNAAKGGKKGKHPENPEATTQNITEEQARTLSYQLFPNRSVASQTVQFVKSTDSLKGNLYGRGITWHVPSEAVIPIHFQGSNRKKCDFIFLVDDDGNFLKNTADADFYQASKKPGQGDNKNPPKVGSTDSLIANLKKVQDGNACDFDMMEFAEMAKASIIRRFMSSVISGKGDNISISIDEETNKIFLARLFKRQGVRCLYVPGESVTYMALKYNRLGIGQSLTNSAKMHIARLAAFDLADAMANLEAASPHTLMEVNVAKEDPDPLHTIAVARQTFFSANPRLHSILSTSQLSVPMIVDALRESSLTVKINAGDNPHIPSPDITLSHMDKENFKPVDPASREEVLNKIVNYFFLPRGWLDVVDGGENNFAIEALVENQMIFNQGVNWQDELCMHLSDFMRKHCSVNAPLLAELVEVITENQKLWKPDSGEPLPGKTDEENIKFILADFITNVFCSLPQPSSTESTSKLKDKLDAIEQLMEAWEEMSAYESLIEPMAKILGLDKDDYAPDAMKGAIKAVLRADAFKRFNLPMPFDDVMGDGKGGGIASLINQVVYQRTNVAEFLAKYVIDVAGADGQILKDHKKKIDAALEKLAALAEPPPEPLDDGMGGDPTLGDDGEPVDPDAPNPDDGSGTTIDDDDELADDGTGDNPDATTTDDPDGTTPAPDDDNDGLDPTKNDPGENPFTGGKS